MAPRTSNLYGKIIISRRAIRQVVEATAAECYGVASVIRRRKRFGLKDTSVYIDDNRVDVSVALYLKFGVTIDPVIESIRRAIKYNVESFTGMTVYCVNIDVLGIKG